VNDRGRSSVPTALEAAIVAAPDDPAPYLVYADWLEAHGDPRAALIRLQQATRSSRARAAASAHLAAHAGALLPPAPLGSQLVWRNGFVRSAGVAIDLEGKPLARQLARLLGHPSTRFLDELRLFVPGRLILGALDLPALTRAELRAGSMSPAAARAIATARWPKLASLEVGYGTRGARLADVAALLVRSDLPELRHLGLSSADLADRLPPLLAASPLLPRLQTLDLSTSTLTDAGARALASQRDAFHHLDVLDVRHNQLTAAGKRALRGLARRVRT
jgi:uncharacterized protein (TIGR02996 family)